MERLANALSLFLGLVFLGGGMSKLFAAHAFPGLMGPVWLEAALEPHGLALYGHFIAWSQALIGYTLFTLLLRSLGAVLLVPLVVNILMVTISLDWRGTPYVVAGFLVMNGLILWIDRKRFAPLLGRPYPHGRPIAWRELLVWTAGLCVFAMGAPVSHVSLPLGYGLSAAGIALGLLAWWRHRRVTSAGTNP